MKIKKGKSLCFFSAKGGVGKTTNIINLAGIIKDLNKTVLIIDFDLYSGGVAIYLDKQPDKNIYTLSNDIINNHYTNIEDYVTQIDENISILCAPIDPRNANKIDTRTIPKIIEEAELKYDIVLIDTNHALDDINLNILSQVDKTLFITTNDPIDLANLKSLISIFNSIELNNYRILLNNSRDPNRNYFSLYDIKKILKHNIDYQLSKNLYLKDMEKLEMNSKIITKDKKFSNVFPEDYQCFISIATYVLGGESNE